jgi:hypothetical protein
MKYAEVTYRGPMQSHNERAPSGETYRFLNPMGGEPRATAVESVKDAAFFEEKGEPFEVEWTPQGELVSKATGPVSDATEVLKDIGYHEKKRIAKAFGVKPESSHPTQEELDEAMEPVVEDLKQQMEN